MEDIDAFFVDSPATVPPVQRTKRISQILEEQEEDDEEEPYDQTVNYNRSERVSNATSRGRPPEEEDYQEDSEESEQDLRSEEEGDQEEYDEDERQSRSDMTGVSSVHRGRRQSGRSDVLSLEASVVAEDQYEEYEQEDDGGTRTMSLEGSKSPVSYCFLLF